MGEKRERLMTSANYEDLLELIKKNSGTFNAVKIDKAYNFAKNAHEGQKRRSGLPYITHPICVACILVGLGMDTDSICAALLHDVVEDTPTEIGEVEKLFGKDVALLIDGVTKLGKIPYFSKEEEQAENVRKMLLTMAQDIRVVIIKLADRLHNLRTLQFMPEQKRRDKALETMEIYAPLAHRLGIRAVKDEMEDVCLRYLDPIGYKEIEDSLAMKSDDRDKFVKIIKEGIKKRVSKLSPSVQVDGRVKSINGIYRKMFFQNRSMEQIYDIYAVRILVDTVNDCYNALGIIHDMYTPIPNRFKDYISTPKINGYQSLHTTVLGKERIPFEVQIRTWSMHRTAEYGIAAHWKYKTGVTKKDAFEEKLSWIKQIIESQEKTDTTGLITTIKTDLSSDEVVVFTPAGDSITLPKGSIPIDFAYAIHSAVGNRMTGAKVDGKIVSIDTKLKNGQIIEILTAKNGHGPGRDWITLVKTNQARNKIRQWFKKEHREENIVEGKNELEFEFRKNGIKLDTEEIKAFLDILCKRQRCKNLDDFYAAIGYGGILLWRLMPRIKDDYLKFKKPDIKCEIKTEAPVVNPISDKNSNGIIIEGIDNCLIKFAKCCNPLPGDEIIGFITRGYGVSVHKRSCRNVPKNIQNAAEPERWVNAQWGSRAIDKFDATLEIVSFNREGLLADVTSEFSNMHLFINSLSTQNLKNGNALVHAVITVNSLEHLRAISARLSKIKGIISVNRG